MHPKHKVYKCKNSRCNEKYNAGPDKDNKIIWQDVCNVKMICNSGLRCAECDKSYLDAKANGTRKYWCTELQKRKASEFFDKKESEKKGAFAR